MTARFGLALTMCLFAVGCESEAPGESIEELSGEDSRDIRGEVVEPPFSVRGEADELLLVWADGEGIHTAANRSQIPEARREHVRVDSLRVAPDDRLDPEYVYLADLRQAGQGGRYTVRKVRRAAFDAWVDRQTGAAEMLAHAAAGESDIIIYGADWCGVCRQAADYFQSRNIDFVEKNIEQDQAAAAEMQAKARAAGVTPRGIPVIDVRGTILTGFDRARIERLLGG